jgi:hypothetical protein
LHVNNRLKEAFLNGWIEEVVCEYNLFVNIFRKMTGILQRRYERNIITEPDSISICINTEEANG